MKITINYALPEINLVHSSFVQFSSDKLTDDIVRKLSIVIDEVLTNIISYSTPISASSTIAIEFLYSAQDIVMIIEDQGTPFNPTLIDDPQINLPLEKRKVGGLGILLIKTLVDDIKYQRIGQTNRLTLSKCVS